MYKLSDLKLKIGYWIVSHKILTKKLFLIILILTEVFLISFSAIKLTRFYSSEKVAFEKTMSQILSHNIDYESYKEKNKPKDIRVTELDSIALDKNKYNFVAKIHNPNKTKWIVKEVEYYFIYNNLKTDIKKTFILPGEKKYITSFGIKSDQKIFKPNIIIINIQWKRIKKADEEKFANEVKKYINFDIKDSQYLNSYLLGIEDDDQISVIRFKAENNTIFDYYEVGFYIATYNGPAMTSINYFLSNNILSGEQRAIEVRWRDSIPIPDKIVILPEVNILDSSIIMSKNNIIGLPK
ncbi:MAG: hypothetical protein U9O55_01345 [Patescibacteria group bacterium]|nr:hypothetical protein [Patescibacteria group bacterium]